MKGKGIYAVVALVLLGLIGFCVIRFTSIFESNNNVAEISNAEFTEQPVGYLDRISSLVVSTPDLQHISLQINTNTSEAQLITALQNVQPGKELLVTVVAGMDGVLQMITDGEFDRVLRILCRAFPDPEKTYLRWDPDMEVPVRRYAWQYQSPADYIAAFRHIAGICRGETPSLRIMWAPAGYPGTEEYWPGGDAVDAIGISVNGKSEAEATFYPKEPDYRTALRRKIIRTRFMSKPLLVLASGQDSVIGILKQDLKLVAEQIRQDSSWLFQRYEIRRPDARNAKVPLMGVYDPQQLLTASKDVHVEHLFVDLGNIQSGAFARDFEAIVGRGHQPIVTVEPWRDSKIRKDSSVLQNTVQGIYDEEFRSLFQTISTTNQTVYVRFAHEMEIPIHRYSWQSQDPALYIKAFRHFMELGKDARNVKKVWGPAGDRGSMEWYPGGDAVDFVSIAIYGLPDKNITDPTKQESFETIFDRKIWRMRFASKPIFITEFGVKGPENYQSEWMKKAGECLAKHKEVWGVCYFNLADNPEVWGNIPAPDWSISRATFDHFVRALHAAN